jgi:hypothetical protein
MPQPFIDILKFLDNNVEVLASKVSEKSISRSDADRWLEQLMTCESLEPSTCEFVRGYFEGRLRTLHPTCKEQKL